MADTKIEVSGEMNVPPVQTGSKFPLEFGTIPRIQDLPTTLELVKFARQYLRPWTEFLNTSNFKSAVSMPRLTNRVIRNLKYFQSNYICVFIVLMIYCLITSPLILFVIAGVVFASYKIRQSQSSITVFGQQLTIKHQIIALNIIAVPILFLVGAGTALFWTLGASFFLIILHSSFYNIDAIVTEDTDNFLSEVI